MTRDLTRHKCPHAPAHGSRSGQWPLGCREPPDMAFQGGRPPATERGHHLANELSNDAAYSSAHHPGPSSEGLGSGLECPSPPQLTSVLCRHHARRQTSSRQLGGDLGGPHPPRETQHSRRPGTLAGPAPPSPVGTCTCLPPLQQGGSPGRTRRPRLPAWGSDPPRAACAHWGKAATSAEHPGGLGSSARGQ